MGTISKQHTFSAGATIIASEHNDNFDDLYNLVNGEIENVNVKSTAGIVATKLNLSTITQNMTLSGDVTFTGTDTFSTVDINNGTVDATSIGQDSQSAGSFTTLEATTSLKIGSGATITTILDEDDMSSDSASASVTQQSVKAYVATQIINTFTAGDIVAAQSNDEASTASAALVKLKEIKIPHGGTLRCTWEEKITGGGNVNAIIYRNGVSAGVQKTSASSSYVAQSDDVSGWSEGDLCQLYVNAETSGTSYVQLFKIKIAETKWGFSVIT